MTPHGERQAHTSRLVHWGALVLGIVLFVGALYYINVSLAMGTIRQLGVALPLALLFSGLWHLARTWAWAWCFPRPRTVSFLRLVRVRLAAEAFSYLTLRGIAGEPLKVVLLSDRVDARQATAAVALERLAYTIGTTVIVGIGSVLAIAMLPLGRVWFRVFRAFAIAAFVITALSAIVIAGRGTYFGALLSRVDRALGTSIAGGRVGRFAIAVERQMLELVRGNPARLLVLLTTTLLAYTLMALEAWVILKATGVHISAVSALTVETFSRVASFASAFIPANLGALEASSLAAVAAVGAAGGGAALALARRLRGLFWAGAPSTLLYVVHDPAVTVSPATRLAGLPICERVLRPALRSGHTRIVAWVPQDTAAPRQRPDCLRAIRGITRNIGARVTVATTEREWREALASLDPAETVTAIGVGTIVSTALLADARAIRAAAGVVRDVPAGTEWPESGVVRIVAGDAASPTELSQLLQARRARALPLPTGKEVADGLARLALRIVTPEDMPAAEETIRRASYKSTDAKLARFNRRMSLPVSIALIRTPLTANQLSVILVALGFYSAWLFSTGHYLAGVLGGFLSLAASVLDGCDGEIARLKYQESALGCWIETFGDYSYYIAIFVGLTAGAARRTGWEIFYWLGGIALAGTVISFVLLIYLRNRITAGQPERLHAIAKARFKAEPTRWSKIMWRISFVATRAAMPYGIFALSLVHALPLVVVLAAIGSNLYWVSLALKLRHLLGEQAEQVAA